jgi:hypothetical protein
MAANFAVVSPRRFRRLGWFAALALAGLAAAVFARPCPEARRAPPSSAPAPAVAATEDRCAAELAAYASARQAARLAADEGHCRSRGRHGAAVRQAAAAVEACLDRR